VDMNLRLEWKKRRVVELPPKSSSSQRMSSAASVGGSTKRSTSTGRPKSANSVASGRSTSTGRGAQNPHTYRRERQLNQVAKENEAMRQRLEKIGPRAVRGTDRVAVIREAYRAPTAAPSTAAASAASDQKRRADSKPRGPTTSSSLAGDQESKAPTISSASLAKRSYSDLVSLFEDLRSKVAKAQKELQSQRLATNKLKAQAEKHESLVERMKKAEIQSRKGAGGGSSARGTPRGPRDGAAVADRPGDEAMECSYTIEDILLRNGLPENEDEISDQVLRELVAEHSALQQNRVSLLRRLRGATEKAEEVRKESSQLKQEIDEVSSILRQSVKRVPSTNWNLHQQHRPNKLQAARSELETAKDAKKLATVCGELSTSPSLLTHASLRASHTRRVGP
jgi:chromosome segregation ATPase